MNSKRTFKDWIFAVRPWSFPVSSMPALITFVYVFSVFMQKDMPVDWLNGVLAIFGAVIFHASGNVISDYFDYKSGVDRQDTFGQQLIVNQTFTPKTMFQLGLGFLFIGCLLGLFLWTRTGFPILIFGAIGIISCLLYFQFKSHALGEFLIFIVYGPSITMGTYYVMTSSIDWNSFLISLPFVFLTTGVLYANNTRDNISDKRANITTFTMQFSLKGNIRNYQIQMLIGYVALVCLVVFGMLSWVCLLPLITLPLALKNVKAMGSASETNLTPITNLDVQTAQLHMAFSLTFIVSLLISAWL